MNLVHEIIDDLTFDAENVITSTQLPNKENTKWKICDSSFTDLLKKTKGVNVNEKQ